jgi:hypothetical protein
MDLLKPERSGREIGEETEIEMGRSSPKRHCPQKAVQVQAATAASKGRLRLRLEMLSRHVPVTTNPKVCL